MTTDGEDKELLFKMTRAYFAAHAPTKPKEYLDGSLDPVLDMIEWRWAYADLMMKQGGLI